MARLTSELVVSLIDQVTGPARQAAEALGGIPRAARGAAQADIGTRLSAAIGRNNAALESARGAVYEAVGGYYALRTAIAAPVRSAMDFESAMADVAKVVDFPTPEMFGTFQRELRQLSTEVPVAISGLADIAASAGEAGFAADEILKVTRAAAEIGVAFGVSADRAGEALPQMMNAMGLSLDEVILLSDGLNHLSNNMATSAPKLLGFMQSVGADAQAFGFAAKDAAAFGAAMTAAGFGADVSATSFLNMGRALTRGGSATKRQAAAFAKLGLDAKQVARDMSEDATSTTLRVIEALGKVEEAERSAVASNLFGKEARALTPLLTNTELLRDALGLVADETRYAGSAVREFEVRADTFGSAATRFQNQVEGLRIAIGSALLPALSEIIDRIGPAIKAVTRLAEAHPEVTAAVFASAGALVAFRVALSGLRFVGLLGRGGALALLSIAFNTVGRAAIGATRAARSAAALDAALAGMSGARVGRLRSIGVGLRGIGDAATGGRLTWAARSLIAVGAAAAGLGAGPIIAVSAAAAGLAWAGSWLYRNWEGLEAIVRGVGSGLREGLAPAIELVEPLLDAIEPVTRRVGEAFGMLRDAAAGVGEAVAGALAGAGDWFGRLLDPVELAEGQEAKLVALGHSLGLALGRGVSDSALALHAAGMGLIGQLEDGAKAAFNWVLSWAFTVAPKVRDAVLSSADAMASAGADMIQAFWDGMKAKFAEAAAWAREQASALADKLGGIGQGTGSQLRGNIEAQQRKMLGLPPEQQFARGGWMPGGHAALVGEEGPEVVTPRRDGWVTTNDELVEGLRARAEAYRRLTAAGAPPARSEPRAEDRRPAQVSVTVPVTINGVQDIRGAADDIARVIDDAIRRRLDASFMRA